MPSAAPHICPDSAHTCDNPDDLMYPYVNGTLATAILDPGRDDWYGHSSPWFDVQDSPFLKHLQEQVHLTVGITGAGEVTSEPAGRRLHRHVRPGLGRRLRGQPRRRPRQRPALRPLDGACSGAERLHA